MNAAVSPEVSGPVARIGRLAPSAARPNKASFKALAPVLTSQYAIELVANACDYAACAQHREGIATIIEKRSPQFFDKCDFHDQ